MLNAQQQRTKTINIKEMQEQQKLQLRKLKLTGECATSSFFREINMINKDLLVMQIFIKKVCF